MDTKSLPIRLDASPSLHPAAAGDERVRVAPTRLGEINTSAHETSISIGQTSSASEVTEYLTDTKQSTVILLPGATTSIVSILQSLSCTLIFFE